MPRLTLRQRLERCKQQIERARKQHRKSEDAYREAVDVMKRILRRENAQVRRAAPWEQRRCDSCGGSGVVSKYTCDGSDFEWPGECDECNGSGSVWVSKNGAIAKYPGGPFVGRLSKVERRAAQ